MLRLFAGRYSMPKKSWLKPGFNQLALALALALVAFAITIQMIRPASRNPYAGMRQDDLVQVLDGLNAESERLNREIAELSATRDELRSGADAREVSQREAEKRLQTLAILVGTQPTSGPGITVTITAPSDKFTAAALLNAVQELKDAGAEVIEINDQVRLAANSWFASLDNQIVVDNHIVDFPITIDAIGDAHSLEEGARFRGGLVSRVEGSNIGGHVDIVQQDTVLIESVRELPDFQVAKPA